MRVPCASATSHHPAIHTPARFHTLLLDLQAAGLLALVKALAAADCCDICVCAPSGERSAQSHAITLGRYLACYPSPVPGAVAAFAVDGTPADAAMLALNSDVFAVRGRPGGCPPAAWHGLARV
jgi:hypothetical protein